MTARIIAKILPRWPGRPAAKLIGLSKRDQWELDELRRRRDKQQRPES